MLWLREKEIFNREHDALKSTATMRQRAFGRKEKVIIPSSKSG